MMAPPSTGLLAEIAQQKRLEIEALEPYAAQLEQQAYGRRSPARGFAERLRAESPAIIAELKKASPSRGLLATNYHPAFLAHRYQEGGAACLSVLTDKIYFQGSLHDMEAARAAVSLPVLRKEFILDRLQIFEAAAHGADAVLLIAALLTVEEMQAFRELAAGLQMAALVEVHDGEELARAIDAGAEMIGVNNRNLDTLAVSLDTSVRLSYLMPGNVLRVSESGIYTRADVEMLAGAGFSAFLIGESLMRAGDPAAALQELLGKGDA